MRRSWLIFKKQREEILQQIGRHEGGLKFVNQQIEDNSREQKLLLNRMIILKELYQPAKVRVILKPMIN